jgi:hypothetical protein
VTCSTGLEDMASKECCCFLLRRNEEEKKTSDGDLFQGVNQSCLSEMHRNFVDVPTRDSRANNFVCA